VNCAVPSSKDHEVNNISVAMDIRLIETPEGLAAVEELQRRVWPGSDVEVVPVHMLVAAVHGGGMVIGAYEGDTLVGFVFGFPGYDPSPDGLQPRHCSHMAGVHPDYQSTGLGFKLKRAQWQIARKLGYERITWTYDPLLSRNANLNIAKLGAVCNTYRADYYGELRDGLNVGLPTDRFQVDWWVNSHRVNRRLGKQPRKKLDLAHYLSAQVHRVNTTFLTESGMVSPRSLDTPDELIPLLLLEIPADFPALKGEDGSLALEWRMHTRKLFTEVFAAGYLVTDFVYLPGNQPRSYYVLSHGESTL
jgi:predicted GNAT superfamily acetyltransferase